MPLALALSLLWPAAVARAAVSCSFDGAAGIVSVSFAHGDVPTISRLGDAIAVDGVACGTATVTNTDSIDVAFADDPDSDLVVIDLSGGPLAPGATDEGDGSSEIEIDVTGGDGSWDTLRIVGTSGPDAFDASFLAVNMNAGETVTDSDVTLDDTISIELIAVDGDDTLSVDPFSAYGGVTMLGGDGDDRISGRLGGSDDVLDAGPGRDVAEYLWEPNELDLVWDESGDAHFLSGYGDVIANVEVAVLTDGGDSVTYEGDAIGETWLGDSFDTVNVIDPSPLVSPDDRIIHGGPGAFDSIRFDLPTPFFAYVELSLDTLGGIWPATYDDFEYIFGSSGDDWFLVDHPGVYPMLVGELGDDTIDLRNAVQGMDVTLGQDIFGDGDWLHTREFERIFGTPFGDVFLGPRAGVVGAVTFHGYAGKDFLRGGDRADVLRGGGGADTLSGGDGADTLFGSAGGDVLRGGFGPDELRGGPGDDVLRGGQGEDACVGGRGRDLVDCER